MAPLDIAAMANQSYLVSVKLFILCWLFLLTPVQASNPAYLSLSNFGDNPGELSSRYLAISPSENSTSANASSLVVLLHGCVQDGVELADKSGLTALALAHNFAVLVPQQSYSNNVKGCFNWFSNQDTMLDSGEMLSIKNMVLAAKQKLNINQVYIIGLSAGGAMASAALVNYPDLFKGGAVVAGLPYPCADNLIKAISCMKTGPADPVDELVAFAKRIHPKQTHWPPLTIWTGETDNVVSPNNAEMLAQQWIKLTQTNSQPEITHGAGYSISSWNNADNVSLVELVNIKQFGHGIAVNPEIENGGAESDFLLKSPISSVVEIIKRWEI